MSADIGDWLWFATFVVIIGVPFWKMYDKTGVNKGWLITLLVPFAGYALLLLVLAISKWPHAKESA